MTRNADSKPALKRDVNLGLFVLYGVGNIIGAGIYVLVGKVAGEAGYLTPFAFVLAALIAGFSGLSYGELAARYPLSAGEAVYVFRAFNRRTLSVVVGLMIALAGLVSAATMARGFVGYLHEFFVAPDWLVVIVLLAALTLIALRGIAESARVAAVLTLIEVGGLLWVIAVAAPNVENLGGLSLAEMIPTNSLAWQGVLGGAFLAFFAFIGFEDMVNIAEEVRHPQRTIPRGIVWAFIISTTLYVLVAMVSIATLSPAELAISEAPLADVYSLATGRPAVLISLIGLAAVINGALIQIIMASRIFYGMSCNGWLPEFLGEVNLRTHTPVRATIIAGLLTILLALALPLISLAKITSAMVLCVFVMINLSLLRIKRLETAPAGVRALPMVVPLIGALASAFILAVSFW
jgi:basic amino acid/polyamine antiporter, APA family